MPAATYHKRKLYVPREVEENLGLMNGDQVEVRVVDDKSFMVVIKRKSSPEESIIHRVLERPFAFQLKAPMKREDYYED